MSSLLAPFRSLARELSRHPAFLLVAVVTLAVGIGANAAIFSVVNAVLIRPLPYAEPERLVGVWHTAPGLEMDQFEHSDGSGDPVHLSGALVISDARDQHGAARGFRRRAVVQSRRRAVGRRVGDSPAGLYAVHTGDGRAACGGRATAVGLGVDIGAAIACP